MVTEVEDVTIAEPVKFECRTAGASFGFNIQPPPALDPHADAAAWKRWKTLFEAYATISKLSERSKEERAATIVAIMGMEAIDLYHSLPLANTGEKANVSKVVEYLEEYFVGKRNEIFEWYIFNSRQQQGGESVQQYIAALRKQAAVCRFESITPDEILRDKIVSSTGRKAKTKSIVPKQVGLESVHRGVSYETTGREASGHHGKWR